MNDERSNSKLITVSSVKDLEEHPSLIILQHNKTFPKVMQSLTNELFLK